MNGGKGLAEERIESVVDYLQGQNAAFQFLEQMEDADSVWMKWHGHPCSEQYNRYRAVFDQLRYACGIGARYFAFQDRRNFVEYHSPKLEVTWAPTGLPGVGEELSPSTDRQGWAHYLRTASVLDWPPGVGPRVFSGKLVIRTDTKSLYDEIRRTDEAQAELLEPGFWKVECIDPVASTMERIHHITRQKFASAPLPAPFRLWVSDEDLEPVTTPYR